MKVSRLLVGLCILILTLHLGLAPGQAQTDEVQDFALFYDALAPYGKWIDYGKYGPVWFPTGVSEDWRPYLNGRWVPTEEAWVFETEEPWGWATYHYGNWFPTIEYGWVWSPGSTWYPSTAVWRTSDDYIGWAPLPPPEYEPVPAFYPEGGYYPGASRWDLLTPPFWTFAPASNFLLGFGRPFAPSFSYWNCGCLAPFLWSPFLAFRTFFLPDFFFSSFAPNAFFAFGPPFPFISRVAGVNIIVINKFVKDVHFRDLKHVLPPKQILDRHPFIRQTVPAPVLQGQRFAVTPVKDIKLAETNLLRPHVTPIPVGVPKVSGEIPQAIALPHRRRTGPDALKGVKGMGFPEKAVVRSARPAPEGKAPQSAVPSPPVTRTGPMTLERREDAGASMIEVVPERRGRVAPSGEALRGTSPPTIPEAALRERQRQEFRALERRQQRELDGQQQELQQLQRRQLRQQDVFREQQRLLEQDQQRQREDLRQQRVLDREQQLRQRQLKEQEVFQSQQRLLQQRQQRQQESLRQQREQLRLEQQLEQRQLRREQQFRQQPQPPRDMEIRPQPQPRRTVPGRPQFRSEPRGRSSSVGQVPSRQVQPRQSLQSVPGRSMRSFQAPRGGAARSSSGRGTGGSGRSSGGFGSRGGMGFGGMSR